MMPPEQTRERLLNLMQVMGLLVLVPVGAELLAAYSDSTGHVGKVLFAVAFFACLYGAPALLIRDVVRRNGWGWPSLLLLSATLGVLQAGVIDQSFFSLDYSGYDGFREAAERTWVVPLGLSVFNVQSFLIGHVVFSFGAPLALAEAWRPARSEQAWLGFRGSIVLVAAYVAAAVLILQDQASSGYGTPAQIGVAVAFAVALALAAILVGRRRRPRSPQEQCPKLSRLVLVGFGFGVVQDVVPPSWIGAAILVGCAAGAVAVVRRWSARGWTPRHAAALAVGVLLARGLTAFTYFPLLGEVSATSKYLHNVTMLMLVATAGWVALVSRSGPRAHKPALPSHSAPDSVTRLPVDPLS